ncbi:hypothetical protein V8E51_003775 [Hyaloscypha variabilis]
MEPTPTNISAFMFPSAAFTPNPPPAVESSSIKHWPSSTLNPKNRIDSLELLPAPTWKIDGGSADGIRLFAIPNFARGRPPMQIETCIPEIEDIPEHLRDVLQPNSSMFRESVDVGSSSISRHILRALENWSATRFGGDFEKEYSSMPYGSRIIFENIAADVRDIKIHFVPAYDVEREYLSKKALQAMWNLPSNAWPETLDLGQLQFQRQLDYVVSLVSLPGTDGREYIFKSLTHDLKHFYHELRLLLTLEPHPNIISHPLYIVTKKCQFGGKVGVCGMILPYHSAGGLRGVLRRQSLNPQRDLRDEIRWAQQITSALIHIRERSPAFYTNLKLDNIVMASSSETGTLQPVLIDFEQRIGSPVWTPPEVHYIIYLTSLATASPSPSIRQKYTALLQTHRIPFTNPSPTALYKNPPHGYCEPWPSFTPAEQEAAQVYMLGKLLWCLFENATLLNTHISITSFRDQPAVPDLLFPAFRRTPPVLRDCILQCTAGSGEARGRAPPLVARYEERKIFLREGEVGEGRGGREQVQSAMRRWWSREIRDAEMFLGSRRESGVSGGCLQKYIDGRPTLRDVLRVLQSL